MLKKFARHVLTITTVFFALSLLASAATVYINPKYLHIFAFGGFAFTALWFINLFFLIFNLLRKRWRAIYPLIAILLTLGHFINSIQISGIFKSKNFNTDHTLKVMSFNTRMFDYYEWTGKKKINEEVFDFIRKQNPDVICFQEFFSARDKKSYNETHIVARLNQFKYRHIEYNIIRKDGRSYGQATFSKYPIVAQKPLNFRNTNNFSIQTDIRVNNQTIRFFNNHLESVRLKAEHYNLIDSLNFKSDKEKAAGMIEIMSKLRTALAQRASQAETIARHISNSPYPVVVCGDFNDTPVSYVYHTMRGKLSDSFTNAGIGFGQTYNGRLPAFRIDFIFHDKRFETLQYKTFNVKFSDHFPIMATINLKPEE
jgi:endonuclease/exonuclease/phosphatase family metal-dependent hydrolase